MAKLAAADLAPEGKRSHECANLSSRILDGLTGDAADIAYEFGSDKLIATGGARELLKVMEEEIMGFSKDEARELYDIGT